jgi:serine/threonine-protein kinase
MEILKRFKADRHVRQLQSDAKLSHAQLSEARDRLQPMGTVAVRALFAAVTDQPATERSLDMLVRLISEETLPTYLDGLRSPSSTIADAATRALSRATTVDTTRLLALYSDDRFSRARVESILDAQSDRLQPDMLVLMLPELGKEARASAFRLIDKLADERVVPAAIDLVTHADWWIRLHAAKMLARFPDPMARVAVTRLVKDENAAVRLEAVRAAALVHAKEAIPALCGRLSDQDLKVQTAAIESLIAIADVGAVPHLLDSLKNESEYVRRGAVEVLNVVVTTEAIKDLVNALRDADWWVRVRSADALGTLGGPRVVDAVLELTKDPDEFARRYAIEILNAVPDKRAVPTLIEALDDEDWWVRERAVDALGKAGDPSAVEPILRMMGRDTRTLPLCVRALGAIASPAVVAPLCRLAESDDKDTRREALQTLVALSQKNIPAEARETIIAVLEKAGVRVARKVTLKPMNIRTGRPGDSLRPGEMQGPGDFLRPGETPRAGATPSGDASQPPAAGSTPVPGEPVAATPTRNFQNLAPGTELAGRFKVLQRVGGGGFGTVYLVEDVLVREEMVLKILSSQLSLDPTMIRRFVQELKLTRRITHANVIRIHDLLDLDGAHAISMEYFPGRDLGAVLREEGPMSPARAMNVAEQVLDGLAAAHSAGILHRDIKPANLLIGAGDLVKIVDFGLASMSHSTGSRLTQSGILVGTPEYISPEQITGTETDARCDLYSLGVVLYEAMSGIQPFTGTSAVNILFQHLEADVPALGTVAAGIPPHISDAVMRALSRQPADRPASASAMLEMLRAR